MMALQQYTRLEEYGKLARGLWKHHGTRGAVESRDDGWGGESVGWNGYLLGLLLAAGSVGGLADGWVGVWVGG
eukprot:CAMPEP_0174329962 /NCGR_PEP_ID=MMETSP0810-20121108/16286_1 /TAXON_ID=73025 ORGANISM="Eutreptiella gymnastica-like, Strain CCMP1594" /NCGR_SAMPLE_ID=MMETSP0810 /ASSEMBLY_ACC=CAM_ASM_000659 /LENGTH=72 /DNA_ID=CAMNT_0015444823 /DNA_START=38 /DNA_END=254 /DNA_ORIENTATION=-